MTETIESLNELLPCPFCRERALPAGVCFSSPRWVRSSGGTQLTGPFSLVRFVEGILRKARVSRQLREQRSRVSLQSRLSGGGGSLLLTLLRPNSLVTGKNTGNFVNLVGPFQPLAVVSASF